MGESPKFPRVKEIRGRGTPVTSDLTAEVWPFHACAMHPAILY